ncbi:MAG: 2,3-bisphosphoglycerate-independent phosphoglycerate mutase [Deltaproteobacteria bacterium]|jgi:2,3-bisphosphoglycerate-independent phosphoglycerate mutase|nr:2,3-bisphosphoglycerate-independent phosphoglycerate mutase [Deltaproteobacteria bacterium]MBW2537235.1 2,3-bisphosphoglycerate-independent phosphoglycerate mutase [Deltaproteobacteria bacterium]
MTDFTLRKSSLWTPRPGPVTICVMDGVGMGARDEGNAVHLARTPTLDWLMESCPSTQLRAHGTAVGLPTDKDMGNSEVGHNALGAGRVFDQGSKLVSKAIASGDLFRGEVWTSLAKQLVGQGTALHLIGLLSDGNVHSHIDQLFAIIRRADEEGITRCFVHPLLDGRDVPEKSALEYFEPLEGLLREISAKADRTYRIASGGGRMLVTMDRYEADWRVVERGYNAHVHGIGRRFGSAREAIETYRAEDPSLIDQYMAEFVIEEGGKPVGAMQDGDGVIFFNFRGDRAIEISRAFDDEQLPHFDRGRRPDVLYAGMMQYDGDLMIPRRFLVEPPAISRTVGEHLAKNGIRQFACSETQKYGHVTYFWNGNRGGKFDDALETYLCIESDQRPFDEAPWMKATPITDAYLEALASGDYRHLRLNYANGDMVGHTGDRRATIIAVEAVDLCLERVVEANRAHGGILLVTADHGNADQMYEVDKKTGAFKLDDKGAPRPKTSHTLNPVPFIVFDPAFDGEYRLAEVGSPGLSNVAATLLGLLGYEAPEDYDPSLLTFTK